MQGKELIGKEIKYQSVFSSFVHTGTVLDVVGNNYHIDVLGTNDWINREDLAWYEIDGKRYPDYIPYEEFD